LLKSRLFWPILSLILGLAIGLIVGHAAWHTTRTGSGTTTVTQSAPYKQGHRYGLSTISVALATSTPQQYCGAAALNNNLGSDWLLGCINAMTGH